MIRRGIAAMAPSGDDAELYRREAMGAFAHEVRTPLTSIRMVMELARRQSGEGQLLLDAELAEMLATSVNDLQELADDLQEASRMERGRAIMSRGPCDLATAMEAARILLAPRHIDIDGPLPGGIDGPWDSARLARALAGFAESANRIGDGSGSVRLECSDAASELRLTFASGERGSEPKPIAADAGFSFFRARQVVMAMGGSVHCARTERFATITVALPLGDWKAVEDA